MVGKCPSKQMCFHAPRSNRKAARKNRYKIIRHINKQEKEKKCTHLQPQAEIKNINNINQRFQPMYVGAECVSHM